MEDGYLLMQNNTPRIARVDLKRLKLQQKLLNYQILVVITLHLLLQKIQNM